MIAYTAIFIIGREKPGATRIAHRPEISKSSLTALASQLTDTAPPSPDGPVKEMANVADGSQPWILEASDQLALVRRLERDFPTIEEVDCKVGIGVATGADKAFIGPFEDLDVEDDRNLPIAMTRDIVSGEVEWRGLGVVNPFADEGGLVGLECYPHLERHLEDRKDQIAKRHVAQKAPANWYRTIDRIYPALARTPKLLIPDTKGEAHIVYEDGRRYPITSSTTSHPTTGILLQEQLYTAASVLMSPRSAEGGEYSELSELTGLRIFITELAGHIAAEGAR